MSVFEEVMNNAISKAIEEGFLTDFLTRNREALLANPPIEFTEAWKMASYDEAFKIAQSQGLDDADADIFAEAEVAREMIKMGLSYQE